MKLKNVKVGMKVVLKETGDVCTVLEVEDKSYDGYYTVKVDIRDRFDWYTHTELKPYKETDKETPEIEVVESKTPAQQLGYEIGDLFYCKCPRSGDEGVYEFYHDDGTSQPLFKLVDGSCSYDHADGEMGRYFTLSSVTPLPKYKDKRDALIGCEVVYVGYEAPSRQGRWFVEKPEVVTGYVVERDHHPKATSRVVVNFGNSFDGHDGGNYETPKQPNENNWFCKIDELKMVMEDGSYADINLDEIQTLRPAN